MKIIAEIGFNHGGDLDVAEAMIRSAAAHGADTVKFQSFRASDIALPDSPHFDLIGKGELTLAEHKRLKECADAHGVAFMSTPFSEHAVGILEEVGVSEYKIASMDVTNEPLLREVAATGKPVILSTGMADLDEIERALEVLSEAGSSPISLLHCIAKYPPEADDLNLSAIRVMQERFDVPVGYSDHYPGIQGCLAAVFHGAQLVETHFTLDASLPDGDHAHSTEPADLQFLVKFIGNLHTMSGTQDFFVQRPDADLQTLFRRGLYCTRDMEAGEVLSKDDFFCCRPESALGPNDLFRLLGQPLLKSVHAREALTLEHVEQVDSSV